MGWPVAHSLSPRLHNYWLQKMGIDGAYVPLSVPPEKLEVAFKLLPELGFHGWNVTVPHKEAAHTLCESLTEAARAIGAVNTVVVRDGKLVGDNTDAAGFWRNVQAHVPGCNFNHALVLGAGGAARAVVYALKQAGVMQITLANRSVARAEALAGEFGVRVAAWENIDLSAVDLLVNTTTLGMQGQPELEVPLEALPAQAVVADIVYTPRETPLLLAAKKRRLSVVPGLGMLVHQAVPGFAGWFGVEPVVDAGVWELLA